MRIHSLALALIVSSLVTTSTLADTDPPKPWNMRQVTKLSMTLVSSSRLLLMDAESEGRMGRRWMAVQDLRQLDREIEHYARRLDRRAESHEGSLRDFENLVMQHEMTVRTFCDARFSRHLERQFERLNRDVHELNKYYGVRTRYQPSPFNPCWSL